MMTLEQRNVNNMSVMTFFMPNRQHSFVCTDYLIFVDFQFCRFFKNIKLSSFFVLSLILITLIFSLPVGLL